MIPKRFEDIEFSDLEVLLNNQVAEGKTIEYKKELVTNADSDKVPFLAGVSAFANTIGGDFIIGIEAKDGIPINLSGANFTNADAEILKLEQMLQNGLEPRLPSVNTKEIQSPNGEKFIFVRVGRSWIAPHRVKANDKFYGRNSKGKYPLDVSELRTAFMLSEQLSERIKNFRLERVKKIQTNDELPIELAEGGKLALHLVPLSAFTMPAEINVAKVYKENNLSVIGSGWSKTINLDGVLSYSRNRDNKAEAYTQNFRNGCVEATYVFSSRDKDEKYIPSTYCEERLVHAVKEYCKFYSDLEIETPVYLFLTLIDVKNYRLAVNNEFKRRDEQLLDRNNLFLPEVIVDNYETNPEEILRPVFDMIWNAYGYVRCFNYDENGKWGSR